MNISAVSKSFLMSGSLILYSCTDSIFTSTVSPLIILNSVIWRFLKRFNYPSDVLHPETGRFLVLIWQKISQTWLFMFSFPVFFLKNLFFKKVSFPSKMAIISLSLLLMALISPMKIPNSDEIFLWVTFNIFE